MFPPSWLPVLQAVVRRRLAFLVSGGTGAGKTTLLAALLGCADAGDRLLLVEDVRELAVDHPHVVRLEARPANVEGAGEVTLTTLVRQALRMRPDRIVVGRGARGRGARAAGRPQHRPRGRVRHDPRQRAGRRAGSARGARCAGRTRAGGRAGAGGRRYRPRLHVVRDGPARRLSAIAAVLRRPGGPVVVPALDWAGGGAVPVTGAAWPTLEAAPSIPRSSPDASRLTPLRLRRLVPCRDLGHGRRGGHGGERGPGIGRGADRISDRSLDRGWDPESGQASGRASDRASDRGRRVVGIGRGGLAGYRHPGCRAKPACDGHGPDVAGPGPLDGVLHGPPGTTGPVGVDHDWRGSSSGRFCGIDCVATGSNCPLPPVALSA